MSLPASNPPYIPPGDRKGDLLLVAYLFWLIVLSLLLLFVLAIKTKLKG